MSTDPTIETIAVQDDSLGKAVGTIKERNRQYRYAQSQKES